MKQKIDFILNENSEERMIFRFFPDISCNYCFDKYPNSLEDIDIAYYTWAIIYQCKINNDWITKNEKKCELEEDSQLYLVSKACVNIFNEDWFNQNVKYFCPAGCGVSWYFYKLNATDYFMFYLIGNNIETRFILHKEKMIAFGEYLLNCCKYMLDYKECAIGTE